MRESRVGVLCSHGLDECVAGRESDAVVARAGWDGDEVGGLHAHPVVGVEGGDCPAEAVELQSFVWAVVPFSVV